MTDCGCNAEYVCDMHDTSQTGKQEMFEQMVEDGYAAFESAREEAEDGV
jgi:hypothetical protein